MSDAADTSAPEAPTAPLPEFRLVITRPDGPGPLGPYRLALAVGFALLVAGGRMWTSISHGHADDSALIVAGAAGAFVWVVTTVINRILATAGRHASRRTSLSSADSAAAP
ncbi:hypothetical protein [Ilumatobacter sp.]|uniref:hypothetical protein n=1 Tax=Ilumatobacter sp. TaxID=1967498 RepID=UPI003B52D7C1